MIRILFHDDLYDRGAIDEAVEAFDGLARFTVETEDHGYLVGLEPSDGTNVAPADLAAEFANYSLGRTVERRGRPSDRFGAAGRE